MARRNHNNSTGHGTGPLMPADLHTILERDRRRMKRKKWLRVGKKGQRQR